MAPSESEGDEMDDLETENGTSDADGEEEEVDEDVLDNDPDDATEGDDVCSIQSLLCLPVLYKCTHCPRNHFPRTLRRVKMKTTMKTLSTPGRTSIWT
jgi:hypothetical protein